VLATVYANYRLLHSHSSHN